MRVARSLVRLLGPLLAPWRPTPFAVVQAICGAVVGVRLVRGARRPPPLAPLPHTAPPGGVTVVIPARDEAKRIGPLLAALVADAQVDRVIVVDDESSDGTTDVARAAGIKVDVIAGRPLPPGWVGKPWALQQGLDAAVLDSPSGHQASRVIATLDADVVPQPGAFGALVHELDRGRWDVLTAGGRFVVGGAAEQMLHAAFLAGLVVRFGAPGAATSDPERLIGNGQCLVAEAAPLVALGGFGAASSHMTDDIAVLRALARTGARVGFVDGGRLIDVDMHDGVADVWTQWGRSLPMADVARPRDQVVDLVVLWAAVALPLPRLATGRGTVVDVALVMLRFGLAVGLRASYRSPARFVVAAPLADIAATLRLTTATIRPTRTWRGRTY